MQSSAKLVDLEGNNPARGTNGTAANLQAQLAAGGKTFIATKEHVRHQVQKVKVMVIHVA